MVHLLDLHHVGVPETIASYLVALDDGAFALVDPGPGSTLPRLEAAVAAAGFEMAALTTVLVSHVHLDHAGAAGALARRTGATVVAHPRAAPHLADPSRLLGSARRVYGGAMEELWGTMEPVPPGQLRIVEDGETVELGRRRVRVIEAPGHANHQHAYLLDDGRLFPGDATAIRLPPLRALMPATAPPEIDLEAWERTLDRIEAAAPGQLLLPHFGPIGAAVGPDAAVADHLARLRAALPAWAAVVRAGLDAGERDAEVADRLEAYLRAELAAEGASPDATERSIRAAGPHMCAVGLRRALQPR
jgi:glyoxylase-like metal-dependent hydrolase (beta-lactamase superfamily II)